MRAAVPAYGGTVTSRTSQAYGKHITWPCSQAGEGLPRAMLEAASCGRALVAADVPGCADFVRPGLEGILFKPNSVEELERTIDTLVLQPHLLEGMGNAARQRVLENSTEEIITGQYLQLFAELSDGL